MLKLFFHPIFAILRGTQFLVAIAIFFYFALATLEGPPGTIPAPVLHFIGNILLIGSCWLALVKKQSLLRITTLCALLSLTAELGQGFNADRTVDPLDILANALGLALGFCICWVLEKWIKRYDN